MAIDSQHLNRLLDATLEPHGFQSDSPSYGRTERPGWSAFLPTGMGYAIVMWGKTEDRAAREKAEAEGTDIPPRSLEDFSERLDHLNRIAAILNASGFTSEVEISVNDTPRITITAIPA